MDGPTTLGHPETARPDTGTAVAEIEEIVQRETRAWDTQNVDLLLSVFHPDIVWPWPPTPTSHDPI